MARVRLCLLALLPPALVLSLAVLANGPHNGAFAQVPKPGTLIKFDTHLDHLTQATFAQYQGLAGVKVANKAAFDEMKAHLIAVQKDVKVTHTFIGHGGNAIDCIPIDQQPGARAEVKRGHKLQLTPPDIHAMPKVVATVKAPGAVEGMPVQFKKGLKDKFGNEMYCPEGSIPVRRITLADMTRFRTLNDFFQKHHGGANHRLMKTALKTDVLKTDVLKNEVLKPEAAGTLHRYAHAYQNVNNYGGASWLNLWDPTPTNHQFSLSQQWYVGGSPVQTIEGGWQVYPDLYGHSKPVLFIYWTADGYNNTGAYNLTRPGFIQINHAYGIGSAWSSYSSANGTQWGFQMIWYRDPANGNWWMFLKGAGNQTAIGYYPKSLYGKGQMSKYATEIDYGGEVTGQPGSGQMGSGAFAKTGWQHAAFQKGIYYFPTGGNSAWANLTGSATNTAYYTVDVHNKTGSNWGTYFYFGGPGGK